MADDRLYDFQLPDLGEGVVEGELVKWLVQAGQEVAADQPLVQIMTDKATVEIPSPRKGTIKQLFFGEGDVIPVGAKMLQMELAPGESRPPVIHLAPGAAAPAPAPAPPPKAPAAPPPPPLRPAAPPPPPAAPRPAAPAPAPGAVAAPGLAAAVLAPERRPLATPAVRQLARDLDIDLARIPGTGPGGRITREDVEAATRRPAAAVAAPAAAPARPAAIFAPGEREQRKPIRGLRRKIAEKMVQSAFTAPHVTHVDECDMTALTALRAKARKAAEERGVKLSYLPFVIKAVLAALKQYPYFNASWDQEAGEIVLKGYYNIGFGVATDQGLLVGVVKDADQKSLLGLARETQEIAGRIREGKASLDELTGGTFTLTNFGSLGGLFATPIINHPEVAILGLGKIQKRPVVRDDQIVARDMMYVGTTFDHRIVDGADAVYFTNAIIRYLEMPELLMLEMS